MLRIDDATQGKVNLKKQDVYIADSSATARFTLWQEQIDSLTINLFANVIVNTYMSKKYVDHTLKIGVHIQCC